MRRLQERSISIILLGIVFFTCIVFFGCTSGVSGVPEDVGDEETFTLIYNGYGIKPTQSPNQYEKFIDEIEIRSNGRIKFKQHWGGSLIQQDEVLEALRGGIVDFAVIMPHYYGDTILAANAFMLPYYATSAAEALEIGRGEVGQLVAQEFENYGAKILTWEGAGNFCIFTNKKINNLQDFRNLTFRASSGSVNRWYNDLGLITVNVGYSELYDAVQRGIVNGFASTPYGVKTASLHEVINYAYLPGYAYTVSCEVVSTKTWDRLPEDLQNLILEVSKEVEDWQKDESQRLESDALEFIEGQGVEVIRFSDKDLESLIESVQPIWDEFAEMSDNNSKIIEILRSMR